jgi:hypothetical protein
LPLSTILILFRLCGMFCFFILFIINNMLGL